MIAQHLPLYLLNRWKETAYKLGKKNGKTDIIDLVNFVTKAAAEANDLMFGNLPEIVTPSENKVTLLIEQDVPEALVPTDVRRGKPVNLMQQRLLGWTLNGPIRMWNNHKAVVIFVHASQTLEHEVNYSES